MLSNGSATRPRVRGLREVLTTGQVAKIIQVAPRTVSKWFDSGKLKGYRIPGSNDRRITRKELERFIKEHGIDVCGRFAPSADVCVVTPDRATASALRGEFPNALFFDNPLEMAMDYQGTPCSVLIDSAVAAVSEACSLLRSKGWWVCVLVRDDRSPSDFVVADAALQWPCAPEDVSRLVRRLP